MKVLVLKHFDPKKADKIFSDGSVGYLAVLSQTYVPFIHIIYLFLQTPSWLEEMIGIPTWRELFYQLADQYPDCVMLKFTIKVAVLYGCGR